MNQPKPGTKEHEEWMRKRAEERSRKLFSGGPAEFDERGIISGSDQSIHSTDAESFPEEYMPVWLIHHKASMTLDSPMNLDGSEYMVGIGVVRAINMQEALQLFNVYLQKQYMAVLEAWKCEQYFPKNFVEASQKNNDINEVAKEALETNKISYVCGISSEALKCEQKD